MLEIPSTLSRGDRVPNFLLPGLDDKLWVFYDKVRGFRNLLLVMPATDSATPPALAALRARLPEVQGARIDPFVILSGSEQAVSACAAGFSGEPGFMIFQDPEGGTVPALCKAFGRGPDAPFAILLDENQRILEDLGAPDEGYVERLLAASAREPRPGVEGVFDSTAPALIVPNVLSREQCDSLIERWHSLGHVEGLAQSRDERGRAKALVAHEVKKRRDHRITDQDLSRTLSQLIGRRVAPELSKVFGLQGFVFDYFVVTCYDAARGDYFRPHRDNTTKETQDRLFALTLNLNTGDYEGGGLNFPEYGPALYSPPRGGAILFPCALIHEATPVTRGQRFTLLSFLRRPQQSAKQSPLGIWGGGRG